MQFEKFLILDFAYRLADHVLHAVALMVFIYVLHPLFSRMHFENGPLSERCAYALANNRIVGYLHGYQMAYPIEYIWGGLKLSANHSVTSVTRFHTLYKDCMKPVVRYNEQQTKGLYQYLLLYIDGK